MGAIAVGIDDSGVRRLRFGMNRAQGGAFEEIVMRRTGIILAAALVLAATALAQENAPKPAPEHKKLEIFTGAWVLEGDVKPNPMGPGGKLSENESCEWMDGEFFVVCHVDFKTASGQRLRTLSDRLFDVLQGLYLPRVQQLG